MTVLSRVDGSSLTYTDVELATILTQLQAGNNQHLVVSSVAFIRLAAMRLLLLDTNALHNRKLIETFAIHYDATNAYNLKFTAANIDFDLNSAFDSVGYNTITPVTSLANIFAATFFQADSSAYLAAGQLVSNQGTFGTVPGQLKTLAAGAGMTMHLCRKFDSLYDVSPRLRCSS